MSNTNVSRQAKYQACLTKTWRLDMKLSFLKIFMESLGKGGYQSMGSPAVERRILSDFLAFSKTLHQVFEDEQLDSFTRILVENIYAITSMCELALGEPPYGHRDIALVPTSVSEKEPCYYSALAQEFSDKFERIAESLTETAALAERALERKKLPPSRILGIPTNIPVLIPYSITFWNEILIWIARWLHRYHPGFLPPLVFQVWRYVLFFIAVIFCVILVNLALEASHKIQCGPYIQIEIQKLEELPEKLDSFKNVMKECLEWWRHVVDAIRSDEEDEDEHHE